MRAGGAVRHVAQRVTRRGFLAGAGALIGTTAWSRIDRVRAGELLCGPPPPGFPPGIELSKQRFESWSGEVVVDQLWTATVTRAEDVVVLANWARRHGWTVRARGYMHNWSPLVVTPEQSCAHPVLAVDARALAGISVEVGGMVRVGAGASMEDLLEYLHRAGRGLASVPAVGLVTVGGALAIDGHGAVVPASGEVPAPGEGHGSLSNQLVEVTAVVFDPEADAYVLRTFGRATPEAAVLATHLGRAFLTEVVLRTGPAQHLRCRSVTDQRATTVFAAPSEAGPHSFARLLDEAGRVEVIWFPFTPRPWTKVWSVAPRRPRRSRLTRGPYNYPFSDRFPNPVNELVDQLLTGAGPFSSLGEQLGRAGELVDRVIEGEAAATPLLGAAAYTVAAVGLDALRARDLWGPAHHTQLYIRWTTLRFAELGCAVLTSRDNVQQVVHDFVERYSAMLEDWRARGRFPVNGPLELRATALDDPAACGVSGAVAPLLSAVRPVADHPEWDVAVWLNVLTFPGTPGSYEFLAELEQWVRGAFTAPSAAVRVEWSKGWGYTEAGPWTDDERLASGIPATFRGPATGPEDWDEARARLDRLDPHRVFTNPFVDRLLPRVEAAAPAAGLRDATVS